LIDVQSGMLNVVAFEGEVDAYFLEDVRPGERIAGKVFDGVDSDWSLGTLDLSQSSSLTGISVTGEDAVRLRENGIKSFLVMKLISETNGRSDTGLLSRKVGTLGIFHRRPHRFSWRDISLFRAFCQRVADTIALYHKNLELEELAETLRLQGLMITRVEIVALLAHDLGHKAFESCQNVHTYIESCKKALNSTTERRSHAHLEDKAELAIGSAERIQQSLEQIRKLYGSSAGFIGERTEFGIEDVVKDVIEIMGGGLARAKVQIRQEFSGNTRLSGYRSILTQVLLNLVINSIDAVRTQKNRRPTTITIHAHEERLGEQRRVIVQFWDEGPGINRHKFQNPQDIFLIGKTSKENGTGTGLPVARNLIGQYFKGTLTLDDAEKARFRISIPA
jgi:signal transduction histidine kinase